MEIPTAMWGGRGVVVISLYQQVSQYKICCDQLPHYKEFCVASVIGKMSRQALHYTNITNFTILVRLLKAITSWYDKTVVTKSICWMANNEVIASYIITSLFLNL